MNRLKELRQNKNLKQSDLATILNIDQTTISYWENGKNDISNHFLIKISKFFNVTVDYLLGLEDNSGITYPQRFIEVSDTEKQLIAEFRKSRRSAQKFLIDLDEREENKK